MKIHSFTGGVALANSHNVKVLPEPAVALTKILRLVDRYSSKIACLYLSN